MDLATRPDKNFALADGDFVRVFSVVEKRNLMTISGPVAKPGQFGVDPGKTTVRDVIQRAGGLLYNAADQGEITRVRPTPAGAGDGAVLRGPAEGPGRGPGRRT